MPRVTALYRYPVKGFAPEACEALTILPEGRVAGDRVLGFRFASSPAPDEAWSTKHEFVALVNTPGLARLDLAFDEAALRLRLSRAGTVLADAALDPEGRRCLAAALADYVLGWSENPLSAHPERLPLRLVGDGRTPRYQDNVAGQITLHGRASLAAVAQAPERRLSSTGSLDVATKAWRLGRSTLDRTRRAGGRGHVRRLVLDRCSPARNPRTASGCRAHPLLLKVFRQEVRRSRRMLPRAGGGRIEFGERCGARLSARGGLGWR